MTFRLLPKDVKFFELFVADGENLQAAAQRLHEMVSTFDDVDERVAEIQASRSAATRSTARSAARSRTRSSRRSIARTSTS